MSVVCFHSFSHFCVRLIMNNYILASYLIAFVSMIILLYVSWGDLQVADNKNSDVAKKNIS